MALATNEILVDEQDAWLLEEYTWYRQSNGYIRTNVPTGRIPRYVMMNLHHAIMGQPIWEGDEIDHINRNPADNRRENLRWANRYMQVMNSSRIDKATYINQFGPEKYVVRITREGEYHYVGCYKTEKEAEDARDTWFLRYGG